jgi:hypothetical protein
VNLMSEPGETDGYGPADFVRGFATAEARPIAADREALIALGCRSVERDLLGADRRIRHDASKLARAVVALALEAAAR